MRFIIWAFTSFLLSAGMSNCKKDGSNPTGSISTGGGTGGGTKAATDTFIFKGADMSWITQMEASGIRFYNSAGAQVDGMALMQTFGINSIRLRVWVNPTGGWCNTADVVAKAVRAHTLGFRIMIDFHYSDTWADPGHQTTPSAWASYDLPTLTNTIYSYTLGVLDTLKMAGITPSWVQIGNETNDGMCWPLGRASTGMANFAALVNAGYRAVKAVSDTTRVIVHLSNGFDNKLYRWMFDGLSANNVQFDIIGLSLYPPVGNWISYDDSCSFNMNDLVSRYRKPVMIVEVGMPADQATTCEAFIADLIHRVRAVGGGEGLGVFYWEPESYNHWQGYGLGAFDNTGKPTVAMNAFLQ